MEFRSIWKTQLVKVSLHSPVYSLCFKPDQSQLIAACSNDLFFINPTNGKIIEKKRSHQAPVYCVRCSADGAFFASSSSDGTVVIWRSFNNDGFVTYSSQHATRELVWCPVKQMLISCSSNEYYTWRPDDVRASRTQVKHPIESLAFAPNGEVFIISYSNGTVNVLSTDEQNVLQTFTYSSIVTSISFVTLKDVDYIVTADLDCRVSMYRASDKTLVGKNALPFEALCSASIGDADCFFAFAGVSGKVSLLTSGLSYLGDFDTESKWIWDIAVDNQGRLALGTKEGFVELRSIDFGIAFASSGDVIAYRTSINAMSCRNIITHQQTDLVFFKIIVSLAMCSKFLVIQFKDAVSIYRYVPEKDDPPEEDPEKLPLIKVYEIPGSFENTLFAITPIHLFGATDTELAVQDLSGQTVCCFTFQAPITTICGVNSAKDAALVGCSDGCVYFVMIDMTEPVLLIQRPFPIVSAVRQGLTLAVVDSDKNCVVIDSFTKKEIATYENKTCFAFSDRVDDLYAVSDGLSISIVYKDCLQKQQFIEGTILAFVRNQIVLSNEGAIEIVDATLPFDELIQRGEFESVADLATTGPSSDQWRYIAAESLKQGNLEVAKLAAPSSADHDLSFYVNEIAPDLDEAKWSIEVAAFLGEVKHVKLAEGDSGSSRANELEQAGVSEEALQLYASCGEWNNVLRLAKDKHLERCIVDMQFPQEVSEEAAKVLLDAGLGDGAIRILTKTQNYNSLARAYLFLGQWPEAISLSRLYSSVYNIIYPRFGQLLFETGQWFESLVCFFIPQDRDEREKTFNTILSCVADSCDCDKLAFIELMLGFNDPDCYWTHMTKSICYLAADRLKRFQGMPLSTDDAIDVFYMCYYVMACARTFPLRGVNISEILIMMLTVSSILGQKRWLAYALKELSSFDLDESAKHIAQRCVRANKEAVENKDICVQCPRCGKDFYSSSRFPLLVCGFCGMKTAFSAYTCKPLPLVPFEYKGENAIELIETQPKAKVNDCEMPKDVVNADYMKATAAEYFIVQQLKEKAGVAMQFWFNGNQESVRVCRCCGAMFNEVDYENSTIEQEFCPICYSRQTDNAKQLNLDVQSDILEMLRTFEEESPVSF
ncbi:hypothetical protein TRFO_22306 [Tritrichomonas foetus]|uniref:Intraflagellar transport protein 122 homolog n=1 Tax=Tritrichomonas foetus TaxID=1144522 RepID=A0A1J4KCN1_9EUKA|nr:hypothetical protein TRFO_22306 [Tritrichomonas foetus]|eukprot:OHT08971.1 hypothetical protein TRFO_22306 [Tritrichomonas foetus]